MTQLLTMSGRPSILMSELGPASCLQCQRNKVHQLLDLWLPLPCQTMPDSTIVHIDIVCWPLSPSGGYSYLLTCIDSFTHWVETLPLTNITADTVAQAFVCGWISCTLWCPINYYRPNAWPSIRVISIPPTS